MNQPYLASARYVLTFVDDFSRFTCLFFLKNKDIVSKKFKKFRTLDEKQCSQLVKCLRSDNGGKHVSKAFEGYLSENNCSWKIFVP